MNELQNLKECQIKKKITNEPHISGDPQISKEIEIINEPEILKEQQISNETQITNEPQILKEDKISNEPIF